jgi:tripartite-type tricarboxylate transporter receptor subunit TctC
VNAAPDGHTLLMVSPTNAVNATLYDKLSYNFIRDIAPVAAVTRVANVMVVNPSFPAKTVPEFIAYAKANPDRINMASGWHRLVQPDVGRTVQDAGRRKSRACPLSWRRPRAARSHQRTGTGDVRRNHLVDRVHQAGRLRALGVTTTTRSQALLDVPTIADFVPGYEDSNWWGFGAPKATRAAIVDKLNQEINAALADPRIKARLAELGGTVLAGSPADFGELIATETEKWAKVVKFAGIKPD